MKTLFTNARILTMADGPVFLKGYLAVTGSTISYIGEKKPFFRADKIVDCHNMILMPGLKNAHTHSAMVFLRHFAEGLPLQEWLSQVYPMEAKLTGEDIYWLSQAAYLEYIKGGTTAFFDMYFFPDMIAKSAVDFGIRCVNLYMPNGTEERRKLIEDQFEKYLHQDCLVRPMIGYHAEYTADEGTLQDVSSIAEKYRLPVFTHISETQEEVDGCIKRRNGMSPVEFMDSRGFFKYGGGGYHCIYLTEKDQVLFAQKNLYIVSCPGSNMKLKDGTAPLSKYWKENLIVALGTDGASSNESLSMWREMRLAHEQNPDIPLFDILKMGTVNGAHAMHIPSSDTLSKGKKADIIMVDQPDFDSLLLKTQDSDVKAVMIDGAFPAPDEAKILKESDERTKRLRS
jgi:5-methylthioadenosine/S-adenosylhomocysteine deaminase